MYNSTRTIYNIDLQMSLLRGNKYSLLPNTTLNEKFGIMLEENIIPENEYPKLRYVTIGNGGLPLTDSENKSIKFNQHRAIDGALYNHLPFVIRPVNDDLPLDEQLKYRFKIQTSIDGELYYEYYLKVLDNNDNNKIVEINVEDDIPTVSYFSTVDSSILFPTPDDTERYITDKFSRAVGITSTVNFFLTIDEIEEIKKVIDIKYKDDDTVNYTITEMGLCTGIDKELDSGLIEAIAVQMGFFVPLNYNLELFLVENKPLEKKIELGGMEPIIIQY